ncbi:MAG: hypothetical protein IJT12_03980 [Paludibacteraceae bacterium]|nr:hypothetical protein [Paludibacteraceae bacterium]
MLINGREYEWGDITLTLAGRVVTGARGISYKESQEKNLLYGKGNKPLSVQKGNISYSGELTMLQSEVESLHELARTTHGRASLLELNLNAVVCYGNPAMGDPMITDMLYGIQFTEAEKNMQQGNGNMEIKLPFICVDIVNHA